MPDPRPPSYLQEAHLAEAWAARSAAGRSPAWLAASLELPGPLDGAALETALLGWIDRHEALRSRLVRDRTAPADGTGIARETLPAGAVKLRRKSLGNFPDGPGLTRRIEALFDAETDPLAWPSYVFATVEHGDATTLLLGIDHANVDGYSLLLVAHEMHELWTAARAPAPAPVVEVGSYLDFAALERRRASSVGPDHPAVTRWRDVLAAGGGRLPAFPFPPDVPPDIRADVPADLPTAVAAVAAVDVQGKVPADVPTGLPAPAARAEPDAAPSEPTHPGAAQLGGLDWLLDAAEARAFDAACRAAGGHVLAGVLTCLALAAPEPRGPEFRVLTPFHTRDAPRWTHSVGWYVGLAPVSFPVDASDASDASDAFAAALPRAAAALRAARPTAEVPLARVAELLGRPLEPRFVASYVDMRQLPGARQWPAWRAAALRSRRVHPDEVYLWVNRTFDGVYASFRYPDTPRGRRAVPPYVDRVARQLRQAATAGSREEVLTPC